jgi:hypothetical protein
MVRTLVGFVVVLGFAVSAHTVATAQEHQYVGVKKCRTCHKKELIGDQFGVWQKTKHSQAFEALKGDKALEIAKQKGLAGAPHEAAECLKCHVTAYGVDASLIASPLTASDGVQCESCHGPGKDYRKKKVMADHAKSVAAGLWEPGKDAKICQGCHNEESPTFAGFDFEQAKEKIKHPIPADVKGKYLEVEKKLREEKAAAE